MMLFRKKDAPRALGTLQDAELHYFLGAYSTIRSVAAHRGYCVLLLLAGRIPYFLAPNR